MADEVIYVVVQNGRMRRYLQGSGATEGFDYVFAVGPGVVLPWLDRMSHWRDDEWLVDRCQAGILIDVDRRALLFFTTLSHFDARKRFGYHVALVEAYRRTWAGWTVRWAYEGIGDLLGYLGLDRAAARNDWPVDVLYPDEAPAGDPVRFVVSVTTPDGCRVYGLGYEGIAPWWLGPSVVAQLRAVDQISECSAVPEAGLHLDMIRQQAGVWGMGPLEGLAGRWPALWPSWTLELWDSDYLRHTSACGDALRLPPVDVPAMLRLVARRVFRYWPVEETMDPESLRMTHRQGGNRLAQLDVGVTAEQMTALCAAITRSAI